MHAAWRGDRAAQTAIWKRYLPLVRARMSRSLGGQDVDDHVQEVFLSLFQVLPDLRDPSALRSFIIGITLHVVGTELRRRRGRYWLQLTPSGDLPEPIAPQHDADPPREEVARLPRSSSRSRRRRTASSRSGTSRARSSPKWREAIDVSLATAKRHLARASARLHAIVRREPILAGYLQAASLRRASHGSVVSAVH